MGRVGIRIEKGGIMKMDWVDSFGNKIDTTLELSSGGQSFMEEIVEVCVRHGLVIAHEDPNGGFIIEKADYWNMKHLLEISEEK